MTDVCELLACQWMTEGTWRFGGARYNQIGGEGGQKCKLRLGSQETPLCCWL